VNDLPALACADLWCMKFQHKWVSQADLPQDWRHIANKLKRANLAQYELSFTHDGYKEYVKLKENY
jgi:hypothetical protein